MVRWASSSIKWGLILLLILVLLRAIAPLAIEWGINRQLDRQEGLSGSVGDVDLSLWRGAYQLEDIVLFMDGGSRDYPLLKMERLDFSILWKALWDGHIVAEATLISPQVNLVDFRDNKPEKVAEDSGPEGKKSASERPILNEELTSESTWVDLVEQATPFSIDRIEIKDGAFHFRNPGAQLPVDLRLTSIQSVIRNVTNSEELSGDRMAKVELEAQAMDKAQVRLEGSFNPFQTTPTFDMNLNMERLAMAHLDNFVEIYTPLDIEAGGLDLAMEVAAREGRVKGYLKPGLYDIEVFKWRKDVEQDQDNPLQILFESVAGAVSSLLENDEQDMIATKVPIDGQIDSPDTSPWKIIGGLLKNAFLEAFRIKLEDSVELEDV